jgi:putative ABC transport system permease protein
VTGIHLTLEEVVLSLVLVIVAAAVSFWRKADLEKDLGIAVLRSFLQLTAMGYVIGAVFDSESIWVVLGLLSAMVAFGAFTVT